MRVRIGRNDLCWCKSGKKFKKCHLNRAEEPPVTIQEVIEETKKAFSSRYCLHPKKADCGTNIIKAHTLQRNGSLSKIAKNGKVYSFKENNVADIEKAKGVAAPKLVGIGSASTFTGLCGKHDDALFAPIEKHPFVSSQQHAFLLAYRHLCMEVFTKRSVSGTHQLLRRMDRGRSEPQQRMLQAFAGVASVGQDAGLNDFEKLKDRYDKALLANNFADMSYYVVRTGQTPDVLCSSGILPSHDFDGNVLQELGDITLTPDHISFSVIATDVGGAIVLAWLGASPAAEKLARSLAKQADADLVQSAVRFVFEFCENSYFSPDWWDGLSDETKTALRQRFSKAANPFEGRADDCLKDDGVKSVAWTITARETNLVI